MFHQLLYASLFLLMLWCIGCAAIVLYKNRAQKYWFDKQNDFKQYLYSLVEMIEERDSYTAGHTRRVADYAVRIARALKLNDAEIDNLHRAAMVHDIGKIATPDSILLKPGKLNKIELGMIQQHAISGYQLLYKINTFADIANIVRSHHEKYDGSGYPDGLSGSDIPKLSQIIAIADAFDAMTTDRIYKGRKSVKESLVEIAQLAGHQFDPQYTNIAIKALQNVKLDNSSQTQQNMTEQQRLAYFFNDQLTGLFNRAFLGMLLSPVLDQNMKIKPEQMQYATIIYLQNFSIFNREKGWENGNILLTQVASVLIDMLATSQLFRIHGDEFIILSAQPIDILPLTTQLSKLTINHCIEYKIEQFEITNKIFYSIDTLEKYMHDQSLLSTK
ncbi:HD domain-containing phosphohydrolase [Shewanella sp. A14]